MEYAVLTFPAFWYIEKPPDVSQVDFAAEKTEKCFQFAQDKRDVLRYNKETAILHNLTKAESMKPSPTKKLTAHSAGICLLSGESTDFLVDHRHNKISFFKYDIVCVVFIVL